MIINGRPYTNENQWVDDGLMDAKSPKIQETVSAWINDNIIPRKTVNKQTTSYGLKHALEHDTGIYLTNNEFKDAMMQKGYFPANPNVLNWCYKISSRSKVFKTPQN